MRLDAITSLYNSMSVKGVIDREYTKVDNTVSFGDILNQAITKVNDEQIKSTNIKQEFAMGNIDNVHDVLIQTEKASLSLQTLLAVRSQVLNAYKEIMRIQV